MKKHIFIIFIFFMHIAQIFCDSPSFEMNPINENTQKITISINLDNNELLYKESIDISVDSPYIELSSWHYNKNALDRYDEITKETRTVFDQKIQLSLEATTKKNNVDDSFFYLTYQTNRKATPQQHLFPLHFSKNENKTISNESESYVSQNKPFNQVDEHFSLSNLLHEMQSYSDVVSQLIEQTKSIPIRLILVFLLGILLSLTPCIYPMIPITVGVLQAQKSKSPINNFLHSFAYTLGISTTFAIFGLFASVTGPVYGKLLMSPFLVGILVLFLSYLGFSMFGFYDVQVPKFLQFKNRIISKGSVISSFLFGTASGTIASPCVSPGLILLLSIVASLGNLFLGFLLLFVFGIGLSTPLLLIGTFSSSLTMLPRPGLWMVEIKKIFGFMLFAVCFYYLNNVISHNLLIYLVSFFIAISGFYYFWTGHKHSSKSIKRYSSLMGFCLITASIALFSFNIQEQFLHSSKKTVVSFWQTNYHQALQKARDENKVLFLDFWAEYCSICKSINKKLTIPKIQNVLQKTIPVSINGTDDKKEPYKTLKNKFKIKGFPTYLLVNPKNEQILKKWYSELYTKSEEAFIQELEQYIK